MLEKAIMPESQLVPTNSHYNRLADENKHIVYLATMAWYVCASLSWMVFDFNQPINMLFFILCTGFIYTVLDIVAKMEMTQHRAFRASIRPGTINFCLIAALGLTTGILMGDCNFPLLNLIILVWSWLVLISRFTSLVLTTPLVVFTYLKLAEYVPIWFNL